MASAHSLKKQIHESPEMQKLRKKRMRVRRRIAIASIVFCIACMVGIVFASRLEHIRISEVSISGNKIIDTDDVLAITETKLSGMYFYVLPRNNTFLYPKKAIESELMRIYPRFNTVDVRRNGLNRIDIVLSEERGVALWCGVEIPASLNQDCYFTDTAGVIIDHAPQYSGNVYLRFYGGEIASKVPLLGQSFVSPEEFYRLTYFAEAIKKLGLPVYAVHIGVGEENDLLLDFTGKQKARFRFRATADYDVLIDNMTTALEQSSLRTRLAKEGPLLQYFDLRFSNKVYYKFAKPAVTPTL
jgi:hypothetical protein